MGKSKNIGVCRLCGQTGQLTNEHVPPKGSYHNSAFRVMVHTGEQALDGGRGRIYQRGFHVPSLCGPCNNNTGAWYGVEFSRWSQWGFTVLKAMREKDPPNVPVFVGYPLRIAKQVLSTMVAASQPALTAERPDLAPFLVNRDAVAQPGQFELSAYLCPTATGRSTGLAFAQRDGVSPHWLVEFALPPFGYVLTVRGNPLDPRPADIASFTLASYDDRQAIALPSIPVLPTILALPGDYRSADEIRCDVIENILRENNRPNASAEAHQIMERGEGESFFAMHGEDWNQL